MKGKKGISIMIGYVLLISAAIVMSAFVYKWMKSYVPKESLKCPEGVSVFIKEIKCENFTGGFTMNITLKNTGRFNIGGYFIHASADTGKSIDISPYTPYGKGKGGSVMFSNFGENPLKPNEEITLVFNFSSGAPLNEIYSVDIIPIRFQIENNKKRLASCGDARIRETVENCAFR